MSAAEPTRRLFVVGARRVRPVRTWTLARVRWYGLRPVVSALVSSRVEK